MSIIIDRLSTINTLTNLGTYARWDILRDQTGQPINYQQAVTLFEQAQARGLPLQARSREHGVTLFI